MVDVWCTRAGGEMIYLCSPLLGQCAQRLWFLEIFVPPPPSTLLIIVSPTSCDQLDARTFNRPPPANVRIHISARSAASIPQHPSFHGDGTVLAVR